jgi:hypothetical protein
MTRLEKEKEFLGVLLKENTQKIWFFFSFAGAACGWHVFLRRGAS